MHMRVAVNSHALPVFKKNRIASLLCIFETIIGSPRKHAKEVRVGSHVVSVRIHCTEKWRTSFHTDVLSKSKYT